MDAATFAWRIILYSLPLIQSKVIDSDFPYSYEGPTAIYYVYGFESFQRTRSDSDHFIDSRAWNTQGQDLAVTSLVLQPATLFSMLLRRCDHHHHSIAEASMGSSRKCQSLLERRIAKIIIGPSEIKKGAFVERVWIPVLRREHVGATWKHVWTCSIEQHGIHVPGSVHGNESRSRN